MVIIVWVVIIMILMALSPGNDKPKKEHDH